MHEPDLYAEAAAIIQAELSEACRDTRAQAIAGCDWSAPDKGYVEFTLPALHVRVPVDRPQAMAASAIEEATLILDAAHRTQSERLFREAIADIEEMTRQLVERKGA